MKLIKLSADHYIIVDDSEIKEGDYILMNWSIIRQCDYIDGYMLIDTTQGKHHISICDKITHSTQPVENLNGILGWKDVEILPLPEVKELLGEVDVEKKAFELYESLNKEYFSGGQVAQLTQTNRERQSVCDGFIIGYNQALEDNKDRKYTEEDMIRAYTEGENVRYSMVGEAVLKNKFIQSLQLKTQWDVEFVNGKLKLS